MAPGAPLSAVPPDVLVRVRAPVRRSVAAGLHPAVRPLAVRKVHPGAAAGSQRGQRAAGQPQDHGDSVPGLQHPDAAGSGAAGPGTAAAVAAHDGAGLPVAARAVPHQVRPGI